MKITNEKTDTIISKCTTSDSNGYMDNTFALIFISEDEREEYAHLLSFAKSQKITNKDFWDVRFWGSGIEFINSNDAPDEITTFLDDEEGDDYSYIEISQEEINLLPEVEERVEGIILSVDENGIMFEGNLKYNGEITISTKRISI